MGYELAGRRVLVTGASSGIGAGLAEAFAAAGCAVGICARREERLAETLERCRAHQPESRMWVVDLADPAQVDQLALDAVAELGAVDIVVNNAGIPKRRHASELTIADVEAVMAVNFLSPVRLTLALLPHLRTRPDARVVNVASVAATLSSPGEAAYDASKAALAVFGEAMGIDLWEDGVRVLTVYPGIVKTELFDVPDNDPLKAPVEPISVGELSDAVLAALRAEQLEVYVPAFFADLASGKAANVAAFLAGTAEFVRTQVIPDL